MANVLAVSIDVQLFNNIMTIRNLADLPTIMINIILKRDCTNYLQEFLIKSANSLLTILPSLLTSPTLRMTILLHLILKRTLVISSYKKKIMETQESRVHHPIQYQLY